MTASPEFQEVVIVTGASTGIGAATARELARRGFHVLAGVRRDQDAAAIRGPGIEPLIIDITNPDHIRALANRVHGDPQVRAVRALVNNASIGVNAPVEVFAIDEWRHLFEVNLFGHIAVTQTVLPALIRSRGPYLTKRAMAWFWDAYLPDVAARADVHVSPLNATSERRI